MKALLKRGWHILLIAAGVILPALAALSDATGELGSMGKIGLILAAGIAVITQVPHVWNPPTSSVARRVFSALGTISTFATPVLTQLYTKLPPTTKGYVYLGLAAALLSSWRGAFGKSSAGAPPAAEAPSGEQQG